MTSAIEQFKTLDATIKQAGTITAAVIAFENVAPGERATFAALLADVVKVRPKGKIAEVAEIFSGLIEDAPTESNS